MALATPLEAAMSESSSISPMTALLATSTSVTVAMATDLAAEMRPSAKVRSFL